MKGETQMATLKQRECLFRLYNGNAAAADLADMALNTLISTLDHVELPAKLTRIEVEIAFAGWRSALAQGFCCELEKIFEETAEDGGADDDDDDI
jgi:hypothetical protein